MTMTSRFPTTYQYHPYIDEYMRMVENGEIQSCKEQKLLMKFLRWKLDQPGVVIDAEAIEKSVEKPAPYFSFSLLLGKGSVMHLFTVYVMKMVVLCLIGIYYYLDVVQVKMDISVMTAFIC